MYGYIYLTTCDVNNRCYIGHHKWNKQYTDEEYKLIPAEVKEMFESTLGVRAFSIDKEYLGSGRRLLEDIKVLGKAHFHVEIIDVADTRKELVDKETYWITKYMNEGHHLYNLISRGNTGFDSDEMSKESKERYIRNMKKIAKDLNFVSRFSDVSGEHNGRYGKPVSDITRLRISNANKGRVQSLEEREARRRSHMEKCPDIRPPRRPGVKYINNGKIMRQIWPEEVEEFLQNNPEWVLGRLKGCTKCKNED